MEKENNIYKELIEFLIYQTGIKREEIYLDASLLYDFGIDGDDAVDLFLELEKRFKVDVEGFPKYEYFGQEGGNWFDNDKKKVIRVRDLLKMIEKGSWRIEGII